MDKSARRTRSPMPSRDRVHYFVPDGWVAGELHTVAALAATGRTTSRLQILIATPDPSDVAD